ncbi:MAG: M28 family peptidase [Bacteroidia bacterium]|nr:M28 family peptidase [Bacteroidia bacterium]
MITNCTVGAEIIHIEKEGSNIIGYVDNKATSTIIVGAHYDHLGFGDEGSLYRGEKAIHNGADDNASGTAALIELAKFVRAHGLKNKNYLFLAFSGEEKGLLGSNYFVKHPTIDIKQVSCMINMDMLGRLKTDDKALIINGTGTSPQWKAWLDSIPTGDMRLKTTESGVGPSDHTSFYLQNIPVLHFFSGTHSDYHKPTDDESKINYDGEMQIIELIETLLRKANAADKMVFTKTKDDENEDAPKFKVTLGVVPDYAFEGEGMRIDGVTDGKPASKAGLQAGDIVIQLGENKVLDMMSYMKALGKFTKGETTKVKFIRDKTEIEKDITF